MKLGKSRRTCSAVTAVFNRSQPHGMAEASDARSVAAGDIAHECISITTSSSVDLDEDADVDELADHTFDNEPERRRVLPGRAAVLGVLTILVFAGYETCSLPLLNAGVYGDSFINDGVTYYKDLTLDTARACVTGALCYIADFNILTRSSSITRRHQGTLAQRLHKCHGQGLGIFQNLACTMCKP